MLITYNVQRYVILKLMLVNLINAKDIKKKISITRKMHDIIDQRNIKLNQPVTQEMIAAQHTMATTSSDSGARRPQDILNVKRYIWTSCPIQVSVAKRFNKFLGVDE